ncbi:hypothetical protein [Morganella psychrotolerans]|uniref:Uncharacterized protein n=1 Tax=Morganella psychrotolerans TaxID=368603 RepID=A0A1B8HL32_9GAMM|nr:hypothetical protein [Morganella psychrotolerans]OBU09836.1 hypothetical protein AYY17_17705 [Morganella psychrotolerans]
MAKSPTERKAAQRARQKKTGLVKLELLVDEQELEMLQRNCALRRPGRDPYEQNEYLTSLIRIDDRSLQSEIEQLGRKTCQKCGEKLPVAECCLSGDSACWNTLGWHDLKLRL